MLKYLVGQYSDSSKEMEDISEEELVFHGERGSEASNEILNRTFSDQSN